MSTYSKAAAVAMFVAAGSASAQVATMPAHSTIFNGSTRGYYFTAPIDFRITGVKVLQEPGGAHGFQNWAVVRFDNGTPPPVFSQTTNAFVQLGVGFDEPSDVYSPANIEVLAGDVIGVYGNTMVSAGLGTGKNSYTATSTVATTEILGLPVDLTRSGMQFHLGSSTSPQGMHDIWGQTASTAVTRVEFTYEPLGPNEPGACCLPDGSCTMLLVGECFNQGGLFNGPEVPCSVVTCDQPAACCFVDGSCQVMLPSACLAQGGTFVSTSETCATANCPQPPTGACCLNDGTCNILSVFACDAADGTYHGDNTTCLNVECPTIVISNMPGNDATSSASLGAGRIKAMGFTMGPGDDYQLDRIEMRLGISSLATTPAAWIYDDAGGQPGSILATLETPPVTVTGNQTYVVTPPGALVLESGASYWLVVWASSGSVNWLGSTPAMTPTGLATHSGSLFSTTGGPNPPTAGQTSAIMNSYGVFASPATVGCYANCDGSTTEPILNVDDFTCFINEFAAAQNLPYEQQVTHYANCDGSTTSPVLNVDDFTCFINAFATGCP